jgi:isoleucyl-tRNA synthetase
MHEAILAEFPKYDEKYKDAKTEADFDKILYIREIVKKALEEARADKIIGSSLEAKVTLNCDDSLYNFCLPIIDNLKTIFIISDLELVKGESIYATVKEASGEKCERCWVFDASVGQNKDHPTLCKRCANIIS